MGKSKQPEEMSIPVVFNGRFDKPYKSCNKTDMNVRISYDMQQLSPFKYSSVLF
jgi:hypothetical protein